MKRAAVAAQSRCVLHLAFVPDGGFAAVGCAFLEWAASSAGRAPRSQRGGREFDPPAVHQHFLTIRAVLTGLGLVIRRDRAPYERKGRTGEPRYL